ncbi:hypothetical protein V7128_06905 [Neobacillus vireti]|uniref:hypothetical protein n=1 Tax=Neobacillus vireti TaxID=220686 RepID=UPI002FFFE30B
MNKLYEPITFTNKQIVWNYSTLSPAPVKGKGIGAPKDNFHFHAETPYFHYKMPVKMKPIISIRNVNEKNTTSSSIKKTN